MEEELSKPGADTPERRYTFARLAELKEREAFLAFQEMAFTGIALNATKRKKRPKGWRKYWQILAALLAIGCAHPSIYDELAPPSDSITVVIENHRTQDAIDPHFLLSNPGRFDLGIVRGMGGKLVRKIPKRWLGADGCTTVIAHYAGLGDLVFDRLCWREGDYIDVKLDDIFTPGAAWSHR